jgi:hypothetical protein
LELVVGVEYVPKSPAVYLAVLRDGLVRRELRVFADGWDALDRVLAAQRQCRDHVEDLLEPTGTILRIESKGRVIEFARFNPDGSPHGATRVVRRDEQPWLARSLRLAREAA